MELAERAEDLDFVGATFEPYSPIALMKQWLGGGGNPETTPALWALRCQALFFTRQPQLDGQIWDEIWQGIPFGNLLWVVSVKELDQFGSIVIPEQSKHAQQEGWVCNVGWGICEPEAHSGRRSPFQSPLDLVGRRVFWGAYTGTDLGVGALGASRYDEAGEKVAARNLPRAQQYMSLQIGDLKGLSFKTGGVVL